MLSVEAVATETRTVTLTPESALAVAEEVICSLLKLPRGAFVDERGELCYTYRDGGGSHSWCEKAPVRLATDDDRAAIRVLALILAAK